jgi:hypothetical protein
MTGCGASFTQRPYHFDIPGPTATTTQLMGQRMSRDTETIPVLVDPARGIVLSKWKIIGVSASLRLLPPGTDRAWIIERWRAVVLPRGWQSTVLVDAERVVCDVAGFGWDALNLYGSCLPETTTTQGGQARIDGKGTALATAP